jgi:hypothetical protein
MVAIAHFDTMAVYLSVSGRIHSLGVDLDYRTTNGLGLLLDRQPVLERDAERVRPLLVPTRTVCPLARAETP